MDLLAAKLEPTVVGHEFVKKSLLLALVNAGIPNDKSRDPKRLRIHVLVVGDPSLARSTMITKATQLIPSGRFESAIGSSGIGLTFTVTKEANESHILRLGAIPLATGSVCGINEINQTPLEQQKHYFDFMEEGQSTSGKYAIPARIIGHTTIIASANPKRGKWANQDSDTVQLDDIAILPQVLDRFDIICVLRQRKPDESEDRKYIKAKAEIRRNLQAGVYDKYDENLKKYLMYARTFNPNADMSDEAFSMLNEFWIKMGQTDTDDRGRPRKLEALYRIVLAISKLKLKSQVDRDDANEAMQLYNIVLLHFSRIVPISQSPKELAYNLCIDILRELAPTPVAFTEVIQRAMSRNEQFRLYIGDNLNMRDNWKLRTIYQEILNNEHVELVQEKPAVLKWKGKDEIVKASKQACEECEYVRAPPLDLHEDPEELGVDDGKKEEEINSQTPPLTYSHTSHSSIIPSKESSIPIESYRDLIIEEQLPNAGSTVYRCKEHLDKYYIDLEGIAESPFKVYHNGV